MVQRKPRAPSQRDKQRAATRERIFSAAIEEFRRVGFPNAQIPRIAEAVGVVRGTFYFHFSSLEHVLLELTHRIEEGLISGLREVRAEGAPPFAEVLNRLGVEIEAALSALGDTGLLRDVLAMYVRSPLDEEAADAGVPLLEELSLQLSVAIERGELRADVGPGQLARMVFTSIFGLLAAPASTEGDRRAELGLLTDVMLRGIGA